MPVNLLEEHPGFRRITRAVAAVRPGRAPAVATDPGRAEALSRLRATYRVQLNRDFDFDDAVGIVPYLARFGVSHLYCSPVSRASGSPHGYDIVDHSTINPELGGAAGFDRLVAALKRHGMGLLFDMVPNHMGVLGADNEMWMDVLENGPSSRFASSFDIDWNTVDRRPGRQGAGARARRSLRPGAGSRRTGASLRVRARDVRDLVCGVDFPSTPQPARRCSLARSGHSRRSALAPLAEAMGEIAAGFSGLPARDSAGEAAWLRARSSARLEQALADLAQMHTAVSAAIGRSSPA